MKEIITIEEAKQRLRINYNYGWNFQNYLYTPKNAPKLDEQSNFKYKFKTLPKKYKNFLLKKYLVILKCGVYNIDH
jgi:hypothetical protein